MPCAGPQGRRQPGSRTNRSHTASVVQPRRVRKGFAKACQGKGQVSACQRSSVRVSASKAGAGAERAAGAQAAAQGAQPGAARAGPRTSPAGRRPGGGQDGRVRHVGAEAGCDDGASGDGGATGEPGVGGDAGEDALVAGGDLGTAGIEEGAGAAGSPGGDVEFALVDELREQVAEQQDAWRRRPTHPRRGSSSPLHLRGEALHRDGRTLRFAWCCRTAHRLALPFSTESAKSHAQTSGILGGTRRPPCFDPNWKNASASKHPVHAQAAAQRPCCKGRTHCSRKCNPNGALRPALPPAAPSRTSSRRPHAPFSAAPAHRLPYRLAPRA